MSKRGILTLAGIQILLIAAAVAGSVYPQFYVAVFGFPFVEIGKLMRFLLQSGKIGSAFAALLWGALSLTPAFFALKNAGKQGRRAENAALLFMSLCLFAGLWAMADGAFADGLVPGGGAVMLPVKRAVIGGALWSVIVMWAVFRLLRYIAGDGEKRLLRCMKGAVYALCAAFEFGLAFSEAVGLVAGMAAAQNAAAVFAEIVSFVICAAPYAFDLLVASAGITLLDALMSDMGTVQAALMLAVRAKTALYVSAAAIPAYNLCRVAFAGATNSVNTHVVIMVGSLAFTLAALLLSRLIADNKQLRDENDMFV